MSAHQKVRIVGRIALLVVLLACVSLFFFRRSHPKIPQAIADMRDVYLALNQYALEHHGQLPESLFELYPSYVRDRRLIEDIQFTAPKASLSRLPSDLALLQKPDPKHPEWIVIFHAGGDAAMSRR